MYCSFAAIQLTFQQHLFAAVNVSGEVSSKLVYGEKNFESEAMCAAMCALALLCEVYKVIDTKCYFGRHIHTGGYLSVQANTTVYMRRSNYSNSIHSLSIDLCLIFLENSSIASLRQGVHQTRA